MWLVLQKCAYDVLGVMMDPVRALHDNMKAEVFVAGESAWIQVSNGLRQGCVLTPTLFLLYFYMIIQCWGDRFGGLE